ncbi:MAG: glycosyltransferase family 2 protein [Candidatus Saccharimonadales bacterium]
MVLLILLGIVGIINLAVFLKLKNAFRLLSMPNADDELTHELPSVTICIPARNETHAMTQCLERVVASDYPKLEIIVLDDGSRDDTSILIKSFAHSGVRFVEGKPLPDGWLGKNYAQSVLADEASGKLIFFMDVDTLVSRHTVYRAVEYMTKHHSKMISIIPIRDDHWQISTLMTTMRHFWTIIRFQPDRPRAAANAWMIDRQLLLNQLEADTTLPTSVQMETAIARKLAVSREYRLTMSNSWLGLSYEKRWSSQVETSIRLLYPQCEKNLFQAIGLMAMLFIILVPYVVIWWQPWALILVVANYIVAYYYLSHVWVRYRIVGALLLPVTIFQEIALVVISVYRYTFDKITWKGRPITTEHVS